MRPVESDPEIYGCAIVDDEDAEVTDLGGDEYEAYSPTTQKRARFRFPKGASLLRRIIQFDMEKER